MASKSAYASEEKGAEIEEQLDLLDKLVDRVKVMYEQYFMGIQKQAPAHLHSEAERRLRDLTQLNIRNTALRYRFATIQQKFGAYNTYWKRTLREIEGGRYMRNLNKVRRQAQQTGEDIPEEILAKMPKRMREAVARDREVALAKAARAGKLQVGVDSNDATIDQALPEGIEGFDDDVTTSNDTQPDLRVPHPALGKPMRASDSHKLEDPFGGEDHGDIAEMLTALADEALAAVEKPAPPPKPAPKPPAPPPAKPAAKPSTPPATRRPPTDTVPSPPPTAAQPSPPRAPTSPPAATRPAAKPAGPQSPIPGMSEADTRSLYAKYIKAREVVGEKSDPMSYDKLLRTLSSQAPKILEQHKASGVEFNVVIKDNKVVLKAKPK